MGVPNIARGSVYKPLVRSALASREASGEAGLDEGLIELVNVRVSQINGCAACLDAHVPAARKAGVSQDRLDMLPAWREIAAYTDEERAALRLAEALTRLEDVAEREAAQEAAAEVFTGEQLTAIEWTIVLINAFNRVSIASRHRVRLDD
ncbi:MAG TPA: carboxymuconolactone decarboxylase family protein [Actinomycetales bacterium]|nr:carboxymuconolactone decarboxylase family protein [Actinomycetales bacterium]